MATGGPPEGTGGAAENRARAHAESLLAGDAAARAHGVELLAVGPGRATMAMTVTADMVNGHATCHGGVVFLLADTAFAVACNSHGDAAVAAWASIAFLGPARVGDRLVATAVEQHRFGRNGLCDVAVRRDADGVVLAEFRGHSRVVARGGSG